MYANYFSTSYSEKDSTLLQPDKLTASYATTPESVNTLRHQWWLLLAVGLGTFLFALDIHIVNLALPTLAQDFDSQFSTVEWVPLSYSLTLSSLVLGVGRLGDLWSKKRLYLIGIIIFALSSLGCGTAATISWLIVARVFQGVGAVFVAVLAPAIVAEAFPYQGRGTALGIIGSTGWAGVSIGPPLGGFLLNNFGWSSIFLVNIPVCILSILLTLWLVPTKSHRSHSKVSFDYTGGILLAMSLTFFILGITRWQEEYSVSSMFILLAISAISTVLLLISQTTTTHPIIDVELFESWEFSLSLLLTFIGYAFINTVLFILPFFLELALNFSTNKTGLLIAMLAVVGTCMGPVAGWLADTLGERTISTTGLLSCLIGCWAMSTFSQELTTLGYFLRMLPIGVGYALFQAPNQSEMVGRVSYDRISTVSGLFFFSKALGQVIGTTFIGILFSSLVMSQLQSGSTDSIMQAPSEALVFGEQVSFRIIFVIMAAATLISIYLLKQDIDNKRLSTESND